MANKYDLEERTAQFSEKIIEFSKKLKQNVINIPLVSQLIRAATSIGANYCEANGASSKQDFRNKIYICKKETNETKYWLRIIAQANLESKNEARILYKETQELILIFSKILSTLKKKH